MVDVPSTSPVALVIGAADGIGAEMIPLMDPRSVGEVHSRLHQQSRDAWTFELDLRPFAASW